MFTNYLKIAFRNLIRNGVFSLINIVGLALGVSCSLLIGLWVQDELAMDSFHEKSPVLYRVMQRQTFNGETNAGSHTPGMLSYELKKKFPEVVHASGFTWEDQLNFTVGEKFNKQKVRWAGEDWFKMLSIPLLAGTKATALKTPESVAISRKLADNYFGSPEKALGKTVEVAGSTTPYKVTAVFENLPPQASEKYDFLLTWEDFRKRNSWIENWGNNGPRLIFEVRPDANLANVEKRLKKFLNNYRKEEYPNDLFMQKLSESYLYNDWRGGFQNGGRIEYVRLFSIVAIFILLIACINFMNLSTARSERRSREVGVRKVMGAVRESLIGQFLSESLLISFLAVLLAIGVIELVLPSFNELTEKQLDLQYTRASTYVLLLGITLLTGVIAGSYPAFYLSGFNPARVLKGRLKFSRGSKLFRQGLVVFQFTLSILLIIGTIIIYRQVHFIQNKNLGYNRENLIYVPLEGELSTKFPVAQQQLLRKPGILAVSSINQALGEFGSNTTGVSWPGKDPESRPLFEASAIGYDGLKTLGIKLLAGREFSPKYATDSGAVLVNRAAAQLMGYKDPVGKPITFWDRPGTIVGLVDDFHFHSLHEQIRPLILRLNVGWSPTYYGQMMVRTQPGQTQQALASLESVCKEVNPRFPFTYNFADVEYGKLYRTEQVAGALARIFAGLGIFISCLGLLGLAAFTAEQRTKEIGIRKVLGASIISVITLLSKDFVKLVGIAFVLASPIAWWALNGYLEKFYYHVSLSWWVFVGAGLLALIVAVFTVSSQAFRAATANPVKSLKSE
ncbi:ABC transporter permease [Siphonobacter sp. SORGH_AS_0500]|uniref:ABC transporter permease n=1 Tax=Siphonobacter sp. SORGH_AS_0500 TaxID=1864824 RepID=UPI00285861C6|nr:ABC transporter permease [Siphonobacter sp. SORGH_AS_0500]MDR6196065.1 putative ABC transport system permease protein [Siphonobacter sp. SORGH_AS_0500]